MHFTLQVQDSLETQERKNMQMKKPIMEAKAFHYSFQPIYSKCKKWIKKTPKNKTFFMPLKDEWASECTNSQVKPPH